MGEEPVSLGQSAFEGKIRRHGYEIKSHGLALLLTPLQINAAMLLSGRHFESVL